MTMGRDPRVARHEAAVILNELLDQLIADRDPQAALGRDDLLDEPKRALAERPLIAEMDHHPATRPPRRQAGDDPLAGEGPLVLGQ